MFETSVVRGPAKTARRFSLLTVSLFAHSAVIVGAVAASVATVDFPDVAPDEMVIFQAAFPIPMPPPPLGRPDGGAAPVKKAETPPPPAPRPNEVTAPAEVPDEVPEVEAPGTGDATSTASAAPGGSTGPIGVPWGTDGGVGDLDAPPAIVNASPVENKIYTVGGEVKAPVLIHRVEPGYPETMRRMKQTATVILECVIDRNGRVRDPRVVSNTMPPFNDAVIKAVQQWRYRPGSYGGEAVEVFLNVKVTFGIN